MLRSVKDLSTYSVEATDGKVGKIHGFLFDDESWTVRYIVIDTGKWLPGRKVIFPPNALGKPDARWEAFPVQLSKDRIKEGPDIDSRKPVSRQREIELHTYYGWVPYWSGSFGQAGVDPSMQVANTQRAVTVEDENPHLRSSREVIGYHIHATDGQIGHVEDFLVDEESWIIRYLVVDTKNWLPGRKVLVAPEWAHEIVWSEALVHVDLTRDAIKDSPKYDPSQPLSREEEMRLYDYYGRPKYWG